MGRDWADEWIGLAGVNATDGSLVLDGGPPLYGALAGQRARVVNLLAALDRPGEWVLDRTQSRLLWWPSGKPGAVVELTGSMHVLRLIGASHVHLSELVLEGSRSDALVVEGGRDVRLMRSTLRNAGGRGARLAGLDHAIVDCDIHDTGQGGLLLQSGDRRSLLPAGLLAQGNRIRRVNRWLRTYRPAIQVGGVGNVVRGNLMAELPHSAILFYGNDHLIEFNVIHDVAQETGDVGALYIGRDWTARGHVIRHNHLHDIQGPGRYGSRGVYLDDQASGITVLGNLFVDVDQPVFIGGGRDNLVDNNLFVRSRPALHLDRRGRTWQRTLTDDADGALRRGLREVGHDRPPYSERYPDLARLLSESPGEPRGNVARRNAVADAAPDRIEAPDGITIERRFGPADLRFKAGAPPGSRQAATAFAMADDAPLLRLGFTPLKLDAMHCTAARWDGPPTRPRIMCPWE